MSKFVSISKFKGHLIAAAVAAVVAGHAKATTVTSSATAPGSTSAVTSSQISGSGDYYVSNAATGATVIDKVGQDNGVTTFSFSSGATSFGGIWNLQVTSGFFTTPLDFTDNIDSGKSGSLLLTFANATGTIGYGCIPGASFTTCGMYQSDVGGSLPFAVASLSQPEKGAAYFTSSTPFTSVTVSYKKLDTCSSSCGFAETYALQNAVVTSVPEPETYAMMLAGLGAIGFMARRRRIG